MALQLAILSAGVVVGCTVGHCLAEPLHLGVLHLGDCGDGVGADEPTSDEGDGEESEAHWSFAVGEIIARLSGGR